MPPGEFELIRRHFMRRGAARDDVRVGVGDDAAVVTARAGSELVLALDTVVAGVHFPAELDARLVGHRVLAVNLSDLAAMGADPAWALLGLTLPTADERWLTGFSAGLDALAHRFDVELVGGDTTRGPLCATIALAGFVPAGQALRRRGARPGDDIWVSGTPGDAGGGLALLQGRLQALGEHRDELLRRFHQPEPRVGLGRALRGLATACIDISDGLASDLGKLCAASEVGADLNSRLVPVSNALRTVAGSVPAFTFALGAGDDYELLFTAPATVRGRVDALKAGVALRRIGTISSVAGVRVDGAIPERDIGHGFDHFAD
ncbi:MAG: thiamine-phosphate kinase [Steroidobacteraceae bacterium]